MSILRYSKIIINLWQRCINKQKSELSQDNPLFVVAFQSSLETGEKLKQ